MPTDTNRRPFDPKVTPIGRAWGQEVRHRREEILGLTQVELAEKLGVHQTTVSHIERGVLVPKPELQRVLIRVLGMDDRTVLRLVKGTAA